MTKDVVCAVCHEGCEESGRRLSEHKCLVCCSQSGRNNTRLTNHSLIGRFSESSLLPQFAFRESIIGLFIDRNYQRSASATMCKYPKQQRHSIWLDQ